MRLVLIAQDSLLELAQLNDSRGDDDSLVGGVLELNEAVDGTLMLGVVTNTNSRHVALRPGDTLYVKRKED